MKAIAWYGALAAGVLTVFSPVAAAGVLAASVGVGGYRVAKAWKALG